VGSDLVQISAEEEGEDLNEIGKYEKSIRQCRKIVDKDIKE
jgi:hypothetical protein